MSQLIEHFPQLKESGYRRALYITAVALKEWRDVAIGWWAGKEVGEAAERQKGQDKSKI